MVPSPFRATKDGVAARVKVTPKARRTEMAGVAAGAGDAMLLAVRIAAPPVDSKANAALIKALAAAWNLPVQDLAIAAGAGARRKTVTVRGEPTALLRRLEEWLAHG